MPGKERKQSGQVVKTEAEAQERGAFIEDAMDEQDVMDALTPLDDLDMLTLDGQEGDDYGDR